MATWQLSRRTLRRLKVGIGTILTLGFLYILPSILVSIPAIQSALAKRISKDLTQLFHTPVSLKSISIEGWRNINLQELAIFDSVGRKALSAKELKAGVELEKLLTQDKVYISSARLFDLNLLIDIDSVSGRSNISHIIDALQSDSDEPTTLTIDINNILLRNASIRLLRNARPQHRLDSLSLQASQLLIAPDSLTASLDELRFVAPQGFRVNNLVGRVKVKDQHLMIKDANLELPHSELSLPNLQLNLKKAGLAQIECIDIPESVIDPQDLAPLYAPLHSLKGYSLTISTKIEKQKNDNLKISHFSARMPGLLASDLSSSVDLDSLGGWQGLRLDVSRFSLNTQTLIERGALEQILGAEQTKAIPWAKIKQLGQVNYQGQSDYRKGKDFYTEGLLATDLGRWTLKGNGEFSDDKLSRLSAQVGTSGFNLKPLLGGDAGSVRGEVVADLLFSQGRTYPIGKAQVNLNQLQWASSVYRNVNLTVEGNKSDLYALSLKSQDPNLPLNLSTSFSLKGEKPQDIQAQIYAHNLRLNPFIKGLDHVYAEGDLKLSSLDETQLMGELNLSNLRLMVEDKPLNLSNTRLLSERIGDNHRISLHTPWLNMALVGQYNLKTLKRDILATLTSEIPVLQPIFGKHSSTLKGANRFSLTAEVDSIPSQISQLIGLPIKIKNTALLSATIDSYNKHIDYAFNCNELKLASHRIEDFAMNFNSHQLSISGDAYLYGGTQLIGAKIEGIALDNKFELATDWGHDLENNKNGSLNMVLDLFAPEGKRIESLKDLNAQLSIDHSNLRIHTALWDVAPAKISYAGGVLNIDGLSLSTLGRSLKVSGGLGDIQGLNGLTIQLDNINLRYILEAAGVYFDLLDTDLTGTILAKLNGKQLNASAHVTSPSFFVNKEDIGAIAMNLGFSTEDMMIRLQGMVKQKDGGYSDVQGWIRPQDGAGLDLDFDAHRLNIDFLGSFTKSFLSQLGGKGTGKVRLHGLFEQGVTVEGDADIREGKIGVLALGTSYSFNHALHLNDSTIFLNGIHMRDAEGNTGLVNGRIQHRYFGDFKIDLEADIQQRLKVMQTSSPKDFPAYGNAYASGTARMKGTDQHLFIDVNLTSEKGTDVRLDFDKLSAGKDERLMHFTSLRDTLLKSSLDSTKRQAEALKTDIDLNLKLNVTPDARIGIRLGEDANSLLSGRGEGAIQIIVPSSGAAEVYGTASVHEGEYVFTLQQLARKRFVLREGGSIAFRGNPMKATLHGLQAVYSLTANIADLDEILSKGLGQTNTPVNCVLGLSGEISKPEIKFNLELPRADAEVERRVKALLNTEDAITKQMLYLIALGKFSTNDADKRSTTTTNDWTAVASSAISEQLSSMLNGITEAFRLGTSIKTKSTAFDDTDIELNFSGSLLDNRLTINGNIGYHDNPYLTNQYLGEFDIEYKLNKAGSLRLKGYNHYNAMYQYLRQSLLTQGLGILYRQRFDKLKELLPFSKKRRRLVVTDSIK